MTYVAPNRLAMPVRHSIDTMANSWLPAHEGSNSASWPVAELGIFVPIAIVGRVLVRKLWCAVVSAGTGTVDMGLYLPDGTAVVSATGATVSAGEAYFDVTDTPVGPGLFYIGMSCTTTDVQFTRLGLISPVPAALGMLVQTAASPLPANATFAIDQSVIMCPFMGLIVAPLP